MPREENYPPPDRPRGVQIGIKPDRPGLRYPVEVGLTAELHRKTNRRRQRRIAAWNELLDQVATTVRPGVLPWDPCLPALG